jgi:hypothetical protein
LLYTLTGFTHDLRFRVFTFEGVGEDRIRTAYRVRADIALLPRYGIRVQELPLLCRGILERRDPGDKQDTFTYTEADMSLEASARDARGTKDRARRGSWKAPLPGNPGTA